MRRATLSLIVDLKMMSGFRRQMANLLSVKFVSSKYKKD